MRILVLLFFLVPSFARAELIDSPQPEVEFRQFEKEEIPRSEKAFNFAQVYLAQWVVYYFTQSSIIRDHGNLDNSLAHPFHPEFDKDSFDYNIFKHTLVGNYYYLFYRSRGYGEKSSFAWAFARLLRSNSRSKR